jgi:uncharacterized membrane protein YkoI
MNARVRRSQATLASLLLAATAATAAGASPGGAGPGASPRDPLAAARDQGLTLDEAVARMERRYYARAVRAEARTEDGRTVYRIRLLSGDGRVFEVKVDAGTGDVE